MDEAEERADIAESQVNKLRAKSRDASSKVWSMQSVAGAQNLTLTHAALCWMHLTCAALQVLVQILVR